MRRSPIEQDGSNTSQKRLQVGSNSCRITRSSKLPSKKSHSRPKPTSKRQELPSRIYHQQHPRHSWKQFRPLRQFLWNRRRAREKQTQRRKSCKATCKRFCKIVPLPSRPRSFHRPRMQKISLWTKPNPTKSDRALCNRLVALDLVGGMPRTEKRRCLVSA